jgi:hypothetical protein
MQSRVSRVYVCVGGGGSFRARMTGRHEARGPPRLQLLPPPTPPSDDPEDSDYDAPLTDAKRERLHLQIAQRCSLATVVSDVGTMPSAAGTRMRSSSGSWPRRSGSLG